MEIKVETRTLKERFQDKGFSAHVYAKAYDLDRGLLYHVLEGRTNGKKKGKSRDCVDQLRKDGVWLDGVDGVELTYDPDKRSA